jgi:tetratricopeptide (TPR) repeat protein
MAKKNQEETIVDVQEVYSKSEMFFEKNKKAITYGVGGLALVVLGYFAATRLYFEPREREASENMWKAEEYFRMDSTEKAMYGDDVYMGFEAIASEYSGTKTAKRAHYHMGVILRNQGDFEGALGHFEEASSLKDESIGAFAIGGCGDMNVELGNLDEALNYFLKAAKRSDNAFNRPYYLLKAATVELELGKTDEARKHFREITEDYPESNEFRTAEKLLASLGG